MFHQLSMYLHFEYNQLQSLKPHCLEVLHITRHQALQFLHIHILECHRFLKYNLDPTCVYSCKGVYSKKLNAVIVSLDESNLDLYNIIEPQGQIKND